MTERAALRQAYPLHSDKVSFDKTYTFPLKAKPPSPTSPYRHLQARLPGLHLEGLAGACEHVALSRGRCEAAAAVCALSQVEKSLCQTRPTGRCVFREPHNVIVHNPPDWFVNDSSAGP